MTLHISLFGRFQVLRDGAPIVGLEAHKVQELFSYLLLYRNHTHPRETLAGVLWGERSTTQARKYLRQALWQLQGALDGQTTGSSAWLAVDGEWLRLSLTAQMQLDVELLERAYAMAEGIPGQELGDQQAQALKLAVDMYQGDLLEGWYQDWCLFERERLQNMYLGMLEKLLNCCEARGDYELGLDYGMRSLRYDNARECTHRRMMRLYYLAGNRTAALRQYERCVEALDKELGVGPTNATNAVLKQIREDRLAPRRISATGILPAVAFSAKGDNALGLLAETLRCLKAYQLVIETLRDKLQQDIRSIESVLGQRQ